MKRVETATKKKRKRKDAADYADFRYIYKSEERDLYMHIMYIFKQSQRM